jgi:type II protein arginine methyltransferase
MDYSDGTDDAATVFYIGQHETKRALDVSAELIQHAQDLGVSLCTRNTPRCWR